MWEPLQIPRNSKIVTIKKCPHMGPFNGGESVLGGFYSGDLVRLMYQLSSYYFILFTIQNFNNVCVCLFLCKIPHTGYTTQMWLGESGKAICQSLPNSYYSKFQCNFYVKFPCRLHSPNVAFGESGEAIHQFCRNSYYLYGILNYKISTFTSNLVKSFAYFIK